MKQLRPSDTPKSIYQLRLLKHRLKAELDKLTGIGRTTRLQSNFKYAATKKEIQDLKEQIRDIDNTINQKRGKKNQSVNSIIQNTNKNNITMKPIHSPIQPTIPQTNTGGNINEGLANAELDTTRDKDANSDENNTIATGGHIKDSQHETNPEDTNTFAFNQDNNSKTQNLLNTPTVSAFDKLFQKQSFDQGLYDNDETRFIRKPREKPYSTKFDLTLPKDSILKKNQESSRGANMNLMAKPDLIYQNQRRSRVTKWGTIGGFRSIKPTN